MEVTFGSGLAAGFLAVQKETRYDWWEDSEEFFLTVSLVGNAVERVVESRSGHYVLSAYPKRYPPLCPEVAENMRAESRSFEMHFEDEAREWVHSLHS